MTNAPSGTSKRRVGDRVRDLLTADAQDAGTEYFIQGFLTSAMLALAKVRRAANLTQEDVAKRVGTKQPAIARWEADLDGAISLEHYARFVAACGVVPLDFTFVPAGDLKAYTLANPDAPRTADAYMSWAHAAPTLQQEVQTVGAVTPATTTARRPQDAQSFLQEVEAMLSQAYQPQTPQYQAQQLTTTASPAVAFPKLIAAA